MRVNLSMMKEDRNRRKKIIQELCFLYKCCKQANPQNPAGWSTTQRRALSPRPLSPPESSAPVRSTHLPSLQGAAHRDAASGARAPSHSFSSISLLPDDGRTKWSLSVQVVSMIKSMKPLCSPSPAEMWWALIKPAHCWASTPEVGSVQYGQCWSLELFGISFDCPITTP